MRDPLGRCWNFIRLVQDRSARRTVTFDRGTAIFNDDVPRVHDANVVRLERGFDDVTAPELVVQVEALQAPAGFRHRKLLVPDDDAAARLAPGMERFGLHSSCLVVMSYAGPRSLGEAPTTLVREVSAIDLRPVREQSSRELLPPASHDAIPQLAAFHERTAEVVPTTFLAAPADGEVGAYCMLLREGGVAQIEEVTALRSHRGRGLGTAVVEAALRRALEAGDELVFVLAAEHDWPRDWYGRLGFEAVGRIHQFLRS